MLKLGVEKLSPFIDDPRKIIESGRSGDFRIPIRPSSLPVCLSLRYMKDFIQVRVRNDFVDQLSPSYVDDDNTSK